MAKRKRKEVEFVLHVMSNEPTKLKYDLLEMIQDGVLTNRIGYMDAKNKNTGKIEPMLVGIEQYTDGSFKAYPLARLLDPSEVANYLAPTGTGEWEAPETEKVNALESATNH